VPFPFTGTIDEIRVYYGQVEADEIARHGAATDRKGAKDPRLVLSLSFDAGEAKDAQGKRWGQTSFFVFVSRFGQVAMSLRRRWPDEKSPMSL